MPELVLEGCRPVPLAHYLKALGVLRLVSEQKDSSARGGWRRDRFVLRTALDQEALERFFLEEYRPTPIVGPWGARSGFYPDASEKSARAALDEIASAQNARFAVFVETMEVVKSILDELGLDRKEQVEARKRELMEICRARLPDEAIAWLDACFVVLADDERFPPLLGTGGNEGSGSYMSGFAQQIAACIARREHDVSLNAALWGSCRPSVVGGQTPGHFIPNAGGANLSPGFRGWAGVNPWDYLLCLEGALVFGAAASRRFDTSAPSRLASFPFTVETCLAGYASAAIEKTRGEIWLPVWSGLASAAEVMATFREGRAVIGRHTARDGLDFARAVASLGVDRGIEKFCRFGFEERNGQNNIAVPLGTVKVRSQSGVRLLGDIDSWLDTFRWKASSERAPASVARAARQLEAAIFELCTHGDQLRLQQVLIALGRAEREMTTSPRWTSENHLRPVPALSPEWLRQSDDGSVELRLAASLASVFGQLGSSDGKGTYLPLRRQMEPVQTWKGDTGLRVRFEFSAGRDVAWTSGHLVDALNSVLHRRLVLAVQGGASTYPDRGAITARLGDIADFIEGRVDDQRLAELLWGCILFDFSRLGSERVHLRRREARTPLPSAFYSLLKLCFAGPSVQGYAAQASESNRREREVNEIPIVPQIQRLASAGRGAEASAEAIRRLRGSGIAPAVRPFQVKGATAVRTAAALLFPIGSPDRDLLARIIARPERDDEAPELQPTITERGDIE